MTHYRIYDECFRHRQDARWHALSVFNLEGREAPDEQTLNRLITACACSFRDERPVRLASNEEAASMSHYMAIDQCFRYAGDARWHARTRLATDHGHQPHEAEVDEAIHPCICPENCNLPVAEKTARVLMDRLVEGMRGAS